MMEYLIDTSVLVRLANVRDPASLTAARAVGTLQLRGDGVSLTPQVLVEFRNVATRPVAANGLGLTPAAARAKAAIFEAAFPLLPDVPTVHPAWQTVVDSLGVVGKQVHDARLVAVCHAHGVTHVLTFNVAHFARLAAAPPGVTVVDPASV